jgi:hypothetical protein
VVQIRVRAPVQSPCASSSNRADFVNPYSSACPAVAPSEGGCESDQGLHPSLPELRLGGPCHQGRGAACVEFVPPGLESSGNVTVQLELNDSSV